MAKAASALSRRSSTAIERSTKRLRRRGSGGVRAHLRQLLRKRPVRVHRSGRGRPLPSFRSQRCPRRKPSTTISSSRRETIRRCSPVSRRSCAGRVRRGSARRRRFSRQARERRRLCRLARHAPRDVARPQRCASRSDSRGGHRRPRCVSARRAGQLTADWSWAPWTTSLMGLAELIVGRESINLPADSTEIALPMGPVLVTGALDEWRRSLSVSSTICCPPTNCRPCPSRPSGRDRAFAVGPGHRLTRSYRALLGQKPKVLVL